MPRARRLFKGPASKMGSEASRRTYFSFRRDRARGPRASVAEISRTDRPAVPWKLAHDGPMLSGVGTIIDLADQEWDVVADLFDPDGRRGTPAPIRAAGWLRRCSISPGPAASGVISPSGSR